VKGRTIALVAIGAFAAALLLRRRSRLRYRVRSGTGRLTMSNSEYTLHGKSIGVYTPRGGKSYTSDDIGDFLKRFELHETLRLIGAMSHQLFFMNNQPERRLEGVPISDAVLAYLAMRAIESSNDYRKLRMTPSDLAKAADMYWGLPDPIEDEGQADACLLRFGSSQFDYQRRLDNLLPRTFAIYRDLWKAVPGTIEINSVIKGIAGVNIEEILMFTFAFTGQSRKVGGYFRLYTDVDSTDPELIALFERERQQAFVNWLTCDYKTFRELSREGLAGLPSPSHEKQRFNPLLKYPILKPDRNPQPGAPLVYIDPLPRLVHERVTRGLYFELSDHFMGHGKRNPFRQSFGYVFQEYVGELLKDALGGKGVLAELKYKVGKDEKLTPDWMVIDGDRCLLVEVKQAGLYLNAKMWGDIETVKGDLSKSVGGGVKQLWNFEQAVLSGRHPELAILSGVKEFERIVVSYDHLYYSNSILRDKIRERFVEDGVSVPADYHWHVISIDELEFVLGMHGPNLLRLLKEKRINKDDDQMDFGDYLSKYYADRNATNPYLNRIREAYFGRFEAK
jgi:hypothetical protein